MNLFAQHTKYNVEQLRENKAFMLSFIEQLKSFYYTYNEKGYEKEGVTRRAFSYSNGTMNTLFISINDKTNTINVSFKLLFQNAPKTKAKFEKNYKTYSYMGSGLDVTMEGINKDNVSTYMSDLVWAMEGIGFTPRR